MAVGEGLEPPAASRLVTVFGTARPAYSPTHRERYSVVGLVSAVPHGDRSGRYDSRKRLRSAVYGEDDERSRNQKRMDVSNQSMALATRTCQGYCAACASAHVAAREGLEPSSPRSKRGYQSRWSGHGRSGGGRTRVPPGKSRVRLPLRYAPVTVVRRPGLEPGPPRVRVE